MGQLQDSKGGLSEVKVAVRLEGGVGDCILGCRFIDAIREKNGGESCKIYAWLDTEGNPLQEEVIRYIYPNMFEEITTIQYKKYSKFMISSQWGEEEMKGFIENVPDEYTKDMFSFGKFYDLHIDSLKFITYDFNWWDSFYKILKPELPLLSNDGPNYICSQLVSGSSAVHRLEGWYLDRIIKQIDFLCKGLGWNHYIVSQPETNKFYDGILDSCFKTSLVNSGVNDICELVHNASAFIGVDSAWRLIGYANSIPTITLSKDCHGWGQVPMSHRLRWLCWPDTTFELHHNSDEIVSLLSAMITNKMYKLIPVLNKWDNVDAAIIRRDYKVLEEKSVINDKRG